jgi:drug/metabolite transporter (DMT)-like permease
MKRSDWVLLVIPGIIWGASFFFIAEGLDAFPPQLITPMRLVFGFLTLIPFKGSRVRLPREAYPSLILLGLFWMTFPLSLFPFAEQHVSSSITGMLNGATPLFVATFAGLLARRLPPKQQISGLVVGFVGVVFIAIPTLGEGSSSVFGVSLIILAVSCYGISLNMSGPLQQKYGTLPVIVHSQGVAIVCTLPFGLASLPDATFAWHSLLSIIALGVGGTGIAYVMAITLVGRVGGTRASVTTYVMPVVSLLLGVVLRSEPIALLSLIGCAIALIGAFVTNRPSPTAAHASTN